MTEEEIIQEINRLKRKKELDEKQIKEMKKEIEAWSKQSKFLNNFQKLQKDLKEKKISLDEYIHIVSKLEPSLKEKQARERAISFLIRLNQFPNNTADFIYFHTLLAQIADETQDSTDKDKIRKYLLGLTATKVAFLNSYHECRLLLLKSFISLDLLKDPKTLALFEEIDFNSFVVIFIQMLSIVKEKAEAESIYNFAINVTDKLMKKSEAKQITRENSSIILENHTVFNDCIQVIKIYFNSDFILKTASQLSLANRYSIAQAIHKTLKRIEVSLTDKNISAVLPLILETRNEFSTRVLLDENTNLILVLHEDKKLFDPEKMIRFAQERGVHNIQVFIGEKDKTNALQAIATAQSATTIWFSGHGGPDHFWLADGEPGTENSSKLNNQSAISYLELAKVLTERAKSNNGKLSDLNIIVDSCNALEQMKKSLSHVKANETPLVITSNYYIGTARRFLNGLTDLGLKKGEKLLLDSISKIRDNVFFSQELIQSPAILVPIFDLFIERFKQALNLPQNKTFPDRFLEIGYNNGQNSQKASPKFRLPGIQDPALENLFEIAH